MRKIGACIGVLGSGVAGLTTALCLAEAGEKVRIVSDRPHFQTTSAVAGAIWGPYASDDPRVLDWSLKSLPDLAAIAADDTSGVHFAGGVEAAKVALDVPEWLREIRDFAVCSRDDLPSGYTFGWRYTTALIDMPMYLDYLVRRLTRFGVQIDIIDSPIRSLVEFARSYPAVVNCTGLGARSLVPDPTLKGGGDNSLSSRTRALKDSFLIFLNRRIRLTSLLTGIT